MTLQELTDLAVDGRIHELELLSLEGGLYVLRARRGSGLYTLLDESGKTLPVRSTTHLRELLRFVPRLPCVLVQQVVHDEMCGLREGGASHCACHFFWTSLGSCPLASRGQRDSARRNASGSHNPQRGAKTNAVPSTPRGSVTPANGAPTQ